MSNSKSDKESLEDKATRLYLERNPSAGSQREFDEVVPEFMHRAFYRSTEDEYQTVEPGEVLRSKRRVKFVERSNRHEPEAQLQPEAAPVETPEPVRSAPEPLRSPEPPKSHEPLSPLRSSSAEEQFSEDTVAVPLRSMPQPPQSPPPAAGTWPQSTEKSTGLNYPLLICLLALVSLFVWREQTRPAIPVEQPLPLPRTVPVSEQPQPNAPVLSEESPYPEMSPEVAAPVVEETEPTETASEETVEPTDAERAATLAEDTAEESVSSREASAQRAAILERMSDGTVSNSERTSRPAQDTSLFPATEQPSRPVAAPPPPKAQPPAAKVNEAADTASESLFPEETSQPVATQKPPAVQPKPPVRVNPPAQPVQGEPYQIAEPTF